MSFKHSEAWMRLLGRLGISAMGFVYLAVGGLALQVAFGVGGTLTDARGALAEVGQEPFGQTMLLIIGTGLIANSAFQFLGGIKDVNGDGNGAQAIVGRTFFALSGLLYAALGVSILRMWLGASRGGGEGSGQQEFTARLMEQPLGRWLVAGVGVGIFCMAGYQVWIAVSRRFLVIFRTRKMSEGQIRRVCVVGIWGILARAAVLAFTGWFFIRAALTFDSSEPGGLAKSLAAIARQPYGTVLLAGTALGLMLYAVFAFYLARYRTFSKGGNANR